MANAGETEVRLTFTGQGIVMLPRKKVLKSEELIWKVGSLKCGCFENGSFAFV
ncbi:MAG: hypothetical protein R2867_30290 [Caldilineaceae bacterium]